jgi:Xaa-Pro aminopeptidase
VVRQTFALRTSVIPPENRRIWDYVHEAQNVAGDTARSGVVTGKVDEMARAYIGLMGYGQYFTHRLGHGSWLYTFPADPVDWHSLL